MRILIIGSLVLVLTGCSQSDTDVSACVYSTAGGPKLCLKYISGSQSTFLKNCKEVLIFSRLKDEDIEMVTGASCPGS